MWRWLLAASVAFAAPGFDRDLQPVFRQHCYGCHAAGVRMGSLDVETLDGLLRGGNQGPILVPGNARESRLYLILSGAMEPAMPMDGKRLSSAELEVVRQWIDAGARPDPGELVWRAGLLAGAWGGEVRLWNEQGRLLRRIPAQVGTVLRVALSPDARILTAIARDASRSFATATGEESASAPLPAPASPPSPSALSPDRRRRAELRDDGTVRIEDLF